jgi:L,D-transpeptidase-like protein
MSRSHTRFFGSIIMVAGAGLLAACATAGGSAAPPSPGTSTVSSTVSSTTTPTTTPGPTTMRTMPDVREAEATIVKEPPPPPPGVPCGAGADACVDLSADKAWLLDGGRIALGPVPITTGRPGHLTPPGIFHVQWKDIDHLSKEFDYAPMPYSVFFNSGIAFHEGSLSVQSHGCVHLSASAARAFFNRLDVGDVVQVVP